MRIAAHRAGGKAAAADEARDPRRLRGVVDVGGIESSRYLEAMCVVWVVSALKANNWNQAFKMLRK